MNDFERHVSPKLFVYFYRGLGITQYEQITFCNICECICIYICIRAYMDSDSRTLSL